MILQRLLVTLETSTIQLFTLPRRTPQARLSIKSLRTLMALLSHQHHQRLTTFNPLGLSSHTARALLERFLSPMIFPTPPRPPARAKPQLRLHQQRRSQFLQTFQRTPLLRTCQRPSQLRPTSMIQLSRLMESRSRTTSTRLLNMLRERLTHLLHQRSITFKPPGLSFQTAKDIRERPHLQLILPTPPLLTANQAQALTQRRSKKPTQHLLPRTPSLQKQLSE